MYRAYLGLLSVCCLFALGCGGAPATVELKGVVDLGKVPRPASEEQAYSLKFTWTDAKGEKGDTTCAIDFAKATFETGKAIPAKVPVTIDVVKMVKAGDEDKEMTVVGGLSYQTTDAAVQELTIDLGKKTVAPK